MVCRPIDFSSRDADRKTELLSPSNAIQSLAPVGAFPAMAENWPALGSLQVFNLNATFQETAQH